MALRATAVERTKNLKGFANAQKGSLYAPRRIVGRLTNHQARPGIGSTSIRPAAKIVIALQLRRLN